ncbi:MAG: RNA polymerase sigma factor [Opitutaceae bacterium]|nr:RNA polymerase sigma factor [Opitutaceae bacterium]
MNPSHPESSQWYLTEVQPHREALRTWLVARFPTLPDVDDLMQETIVRVMRAQESGGVRSARALLFATARNLALDALRRQKVVHYVPMAGLDASAAFSDESNVVASVAQQEELELLTRIIQSLPDRCRQIFTLRTAYGLTQQQIADRLGVSLSTVEKQTALGIQLCAKAFAEGGAR